MIPTHSGETLRWSCLFPKCCRSVTGNRTATVKENCFSGPLFDHSSYVEAAAASIRATDSEWLLYLKPTGHLPHHCLQETPENGNPVRCKGSYLSTCSFSHWYRFLTITQSSLKLMTLLPPNNAF